MQQAEDIVDVNDVTGTRCIFHRPGRVVHLFESFREFSFNRPLRLRIQRANFYGNLGLAIAVDYNVASKLFQALRQTGYEELGPAVAFWRYRNERRRNLGDSHGSDLPRRSSDNR